MTNRVENKILLFFPNVFVDLSDNIFIGSSDYKFCLIVKWFALVEVFGDKRKKIIRGDAAQDGATVYLSRFKSVSEFFRCKTDIDCFTIAIH